MLNSEYQIQVEAQLMVYHSLNSF